MCRNSSVFNAESQFQEATVIWSLRILGWRAAARTCRHRTLLVNLSVDMDHPAPVLVLEDIALGLSLMVVFILVANPFPILPEDSSL